MATLESTSTFASPTTFTVRAEPTCTTAVPDHFGHVPPDACNANYGFYPSWEYNLTVAIGFALTSAAHLIEAVIFKKSFCWVIIMGSLWECICFVLRTLGAHDQQNSEYVTFSTLLFLLAPLWINAFAYMVLARLTYYILPERRLLRIRAEYLSKIFVIADVLSFLIQAAGGAMLANQDDPAAALNGTHIYMVGIGVQLFFVLIFTFFAVSFVRRLSFLERIRGLQRNAKWVWPLVWTLLAVMVLIVIRIVFRLIEFSQGASSSNPFLQHEAFQFCLDAFPMLVALGLLNIVHPGIVLRGPDSSFPRGSWKWWKNRKDGKSRSLFIPLDSGSLLEVSPHRGGVDVGL
ncbi:RTA1 like protein-domain-containing protein [Daldinia caldariorum]|uniref:RTA1 like protein-domain-containing protein n=1 Tax=Daldinia caldariorum TaxID=326644 RepID=UPI002007D353|nr:RTA1 like protein-domain-containing protein [Daldinia caldariorum]KAI1463051.1 RTA1 like protein-domain-containing protein [Daldinia caldariorum]